jgi:hypothetical protein
LTPNFAAGIVGLAHPRGMRRPARIEKNWRAGERNDLKEQ